VQRLPLPIKYCGLRRSALQRRNGRFNEATRLQHQRQPTTLTFCALLIQNQYEQPTAQFDGRLIQPGRHVDGWASRLTVTRPDDSCGPHAAESNIVGAQILSLARQCPQFE
jgi:hypothetical protein